MSLHFRTGYCLASSSDLLVSSRLILLGSCALLCRAAVRGATEGAARGRPARRLSEHRGIRLQEPRAPAQADGGEAAGVGGAPRHAGGVRVGDLRVVHSQQARGLAAHLLH